MDGSLVKLANQDPLGWVPFEKRRICGLPKQQHHGLLQGIGWLADAYPAESTIFQFSAEARQRWDHWFSQCWMVAVQQQSDGRIRHGGVHSDGASDKPSERRIGVGLLWAKINRSEPFLQAEFNPNELMVQGYTQIALADSLYFQPTITVLPLVGDRDAEDDSVSGLLQLTMLFFSAFCSADDMWIKGRWSVAVACTKDLSPSLTSPLSLPISHSWLRLPP